MTHEGIGISPQPVEVVAQTEAVSPFEPIAFLTEHGLEDIASDVLNGHGRTFTVAEALTDCGPLRDMVASLAANLKHVDGHKEIIKAAMLAAGKGTTEDQLPDEVKKN